MANHSDSTSPTRTSRGERGSMSVPFVAPFHGNGRDPWHDPVADRSGYSRDLAARAGYPCGPLRHRRRFRFPGPRTDEKKCRPGLDYKQTGLYTSGMRRTRETSEARQRVLETADQLFYQDGI